MLARFRELQPFLLAGAFLLLWLIEGWAPYERGARRWRHAGTNLLLTLLYLIAGIGFGVLNAWLAQLVLTNNFGVLNWIDAPMAITIPAGVLALDLAAYGGHVFKHRVPLFWRFHQVHHSDTHLDVTSGFRFHPVEALISWLFLAPAILLLGISGGAILIFAALYALAALVQHANVRLPARLDKVVRWLFVSPAFHRVHHSPERAETDSNYAALFSLWDHLFQTYQSPEKASGRCGLGDPEADADSLRATLWQPFLRPDRPRTTDTPPGEKPQVFGTVGR